MMKPKYGNITPVTFPDHWLYMLKFKATGIHYHRKKKQLKTGHFCFREKTVLIF